MLLDPQRMEENFEDGSLGLEMILRVSFHPHPLMPNDDDDDETIFVCDRCEELCIGSCYSCKLCSFNLDSRCATSKDETPKERSIKTIVNHFSHLHQITRCKIGILQTQPDFDLACMACRQRLCGIIYACTHCLEFFVHESCLKHMLMEVQSLFHPQHPLHTFPFLTDTERCEACGECVEHLVFSCLQCNISMHYSCAKYQFREIKHNCHADHHLLHLGKGFFGDESPRCTACGLACKDTLFNCLECGFYIHLECIPLPSIVKHKRHLHPLVLTTLVTEDDCEEYYCDTCETQRNPEHDIYYCKECNYTSHIDCVLSEVSANFYICFLNLDYKCAKAIINDENEIAKCDDEDLQRTRTLHFSHPYQLTCCKLSSILTEFGEDMIEEIWEPNKLECVTCKWELQDTQTFMCLPCKFIIHESCMNDLPMQVQNSPFHPHHIFHPPPFFNARGKVRCYACRKKFNGFSFYCTKCNVDLHVTCAKYRTCATKHSCHPHNLLQLGKSIIKGISCHACGRKNCNDSLFSCKKCDFNVHPKCMPLPSSFEHKCHLHPLMLVSPFAEDDSGDYYCNVCETERNPEIDVYYCAECNYIAHIDCVLFEVLEPPEEMLLDPQRMEENFEDGSLGLEMILRVSFHPHPLMPNDDD
ncbi:hypothetical protein Gotur_011962, partial [Gossypium turneri]